MAVRTRIEQFEPPRGTLCNECNECNRERPPIEVKLPTIWTDGKAEVGRVREEKSRREKMRERKSEKKDDAGA